VSEHRKKFCWAFGTAAAFCLCHASFVVATVLADPPTGVTNIFRPLSMPARAIHEVSLLVLAICAGIFLVVGGLLAYTVVRFRQRPTDQGQGVQACNLAVPILAEELAAVSATEARL